MTCPRVDARIECPECGYPYSEARHSLDTVNDPGHKTSGASPLTPVTDNADRGTLCACGTKYVYHHSWYDWHWWYCPTCSPNAETQVCRDKYK